VDEETASVEERSPSPDRTVSRGQNAKLIECCQSDEMCGRASLGCGLLSVRREAANQEERVRAYVAGARRAVFISHLHFAVERVPAFPEARAPLADEFERGQPRGQPPLRRRLVPRLVSQVRWRAPVRAARLPNAITPNNVVNIEVHTKKEQRAHSLGLN
jgi:hypothetical protein